MPPHRSQSENQHHRALSMNLVAETQSICDEYITSIPRLSNVNDLDFTKILPEVTDILEKVGHLDDNVHELPPPSLFCDHEPPSPLETKDSSMRDSLSPGISSALACQVPYAVPFDRLLACNRAFRDARASSSPLGGKTALTQATYGFPGAGWPPGTYNLEGATFRPPTRRSFHGSIRATVPSSSVHKTEYNSKISQGPKSLEQSSAMFTTENFGGGTIAPMGEMGVVCNPFQPDVTPHLGPFSTRKDVQPVPVISSSQFQTDGESQAPQSSVPQPTAQQTSAPVPTGRRMFYCRQRRYGCSFKSCHWGDIGRHKDYACEFRNEAQRKYGDERTTCHLHVKPKTFARPHTLYNHYLSQHPGVPPPTFRRRKTLRFRPRPT